MINYSGYIPICVCCLDIIASTRESASSIYYPDRCITMAFAVEHLIQTGKAVDYLLAHEA